MFKDDSQDFKNSLTSHLVFTSFTLIALIWSWGSNVFMWRSETSLISLLTLNLMLCLGSPGLINQEVLDSFHPHLIVLSWVSRFLTWPWLESFCDLNLTYCDLPNDLTAKCWELGSGPLLKKEMTTQNWNLKGETIKSINVIKPNVYVGVFRHAKV